MDKQFIQTLKGFRDFLPNEKRQRDFVANKIKIVFERFGFEPLETPALEYAALLLGKYGEEADKLVYKFEDRGGREVALRYDQTVPTARVLAQYQGQLPKYFRRYQMQNVFRADKPQKGRFREFAQCDVDIFGSKSFIADAEILACTYFVFKEIGFEGIKLKINDRELLVETLSEFEANSGVSVYSIIQSIDKLDKQSIDLVKEELIGKGISEEDTEKLFEKMSQVKESKSLENIINYIQKLGVSREAIVFDSRLARGLDYYTGMIFEIRLDGYEAGSLGGGGRYDNLIEDLSGLVMPAVGVGLGFDRIVEAANTFGLLPGKDSKQSVLVAFGEDEKYLNKALEVAGKLREEGIATEIYPEMEDLGKQFKLANRKEISYVVVVGEEELIQEKVSLKDMRNGEQEMLNLEEVVGKIRNNKD